ncbi:hypothetical protein HRTV-25_gp68 [Halorubrum tailed virus 25]|uniref:Uncharacterized protein n=1 Tax=Halorubrum tailed virus 25 TaxID=2878006 RepID=A0AAE8XYY0_9CAUD|nr:hypothetical protein M1M37_gp068 [Halorubrum tailed virus 25]UBF22649.1 hypothetical protein HRTV-25_gp68 [Halorubrum tailed virus 25]
MRRERYSPYFLSHTLHRHSGPCPGPGAGTGYGKLVVWFMPKWTEQDSNLRLDIVLSQAGLFIPNPCPVLGRYHYQSFQPG